MTKIDSRINSRFGRFKTIALLTLPFWTLLYSATASSKEKDLLDLSLEELLSIKIVSASGVEQSLKSAAASMLVVSKKQIQQRGYTTLGEVLQDLPGFDLANSHGHDKSIAYQRGYRTNSNQRTLYMFNGIINNMLWSHEFAVNYQVPLASVERIEVLYGPAGAVYGPNAFSGVVNIITKDVTKLSPGERYFDAQVEVGDFETQALEMALGGKFDAVSYAVSGKFHESEGPSLEDFPTWGYLREEYLSDQTIWGPILDMENLGRPFGEYYSAEKERSLLAEVNWHDFKIGFIDWQTRSGYGLKHPLDKGQPNAQWTKGSSHWYIKHQKQVSERLNVENFYKQQKDERFGDWAEAEPDWNADMQGFSFVSYSLWNMQSKAWKFKQDWLFDYNDNWDFRFGFKYENKDMTRAYDICGYWSASFCSNPPEHGDGPEGFGLGIYHSTATGPIPIPNSPAARMPSSNRIVTRDKGTYFQLMHNRAQFDYSAAVRWDDNSEYGSFIKPRVSVSYHLDESNTFKAIYATAFQEPAPIQLYGGWNGRRANPDLRPEEIANIELIWLRQGEDWQHDISIYMTQFDNVIKEQAENAGEREVLGVEYRGNFILTNPIEGADEIDGFVNYTFTQSRSNITYDHELGDWVGSGTDDCQSGTVSSDDLRCRSVDEDLGDIAPHKINVGFNWPLSSQFWLNLRANYSSERELYLANPLRHQGQKLDSYTLVNASLGYKWREMEVLLKVNNLFDTEYYHPGLASANSGNVSFDENGELARYDNGNLVRSGGYQNSLLPQLKRNFALVIKGRF